MHTFIFPLQNGALCDISQVHCGICRIGQLNCRDYLLGKYDDIASSQDLTQKLSIQHFSLHLHNDLLAFYCRFNSAGDIHWMSLAVYLWNFGWDIIGAPLSTPQWYPKRPTSWAAIHTPLVPWHQGSLLQWYLSTSFTLNQTLQHPWWIYTWYRWINGVELLNTCLAL